jgi:hypothetical protein
VASVDAVKRWPESVDHGCGWNAPEIIGSTSGGAPGPVVFSYDNPRSIIALMGLRRSQTRFMYLGVVLRWDVCLGT